MCGNISVLKPKPSLTHKTASFWTKSYTRIKTPNVKQLLMWILFSCGDNLSFPVSGGYCCFQFVCFVYVLLILFNLHYCPADKTCIRLYWGIKFAVQDYTYIHLITGDWLKKTISVCSWRMYPFLVSGTVPPAFSYRSVTSVAACSVLNSLTTS